MKKMLFLTLALVLLAVQAQAISCTSALPASYLKEILEGVHLKAHTYKIAFVRTAGSGTYGAATTSYTGIGADEVPNGGGYTTGGYTIAANGTPPAPTTGSVTSPDTYGYMTFTDLSVNGPLQFAEASTCAVIYNDTVAGKPAVAVLSFGSVFPNQGALTVDFPASGYNTSLISINH